MGSGGGAGAGENLGNLRAQEAGFSVESGCRRPRTCQRWEVKLVPILIGDGSCGDIYLSKGDGPAGMAQALSIDL